MENGDGDFVNGTATGTFPLPGVGDHAAVASDVEENRRLLNMVQSHVHVMYYVNS